MTDKLTARAVSKIKRDWVAGASLYVLAAEHDVSKQAIRYHVCGLERDSTPRIGRPRTFDLDTAATLRRQGVKQTVIAKRLGVSPAAISRALQHVKRAGKAAA